MTIETMLNNYNKNGKGISKASARIIDFPYDTSEKLLEITVTEPWKRISGIVVNTFFYPDALEKANAWLEERLAKNTEEYLGRKTA